MDPTTVLMMTDERPDRYCGLPSASYIERLSRTPRIVGRRAGF